MATRGKETFQWNEGVRCWRLRWWWWRRQQIYHFWNELEQSIVRPFEYSAAGRSDAHGGEFTKAHLDQPVSDPLCFSEDLNDKSVCGRRLTTTEEQ